MSTTGEPEPVVPYANGRVRVFTKPSEQAHVCLGVHSLPLAHPDRYALQLLATALGGGMSSRLFTEVRERRGSRTTSTASTTATPTPARSTRKPVWTSARIDDAVATIAAEVRKIAAEPLPADELEKARSFAKGRFVSSSRARRA